uniref:Uncharacterized protein n=1 Tax=Acrobeloides nanus TaxID=290746 RepID=A0A914ELV3_9BILA
MGRAITFIKGPRSRLNVEIQWLLINHAFELGYRRIHFVAVVRNNASNRALGEFGNQYEGVHRNMRMKQDEFYEHNKIVEENDMVVTSILSSEWPLLRRVVEEWMDDSNVDQNGQPIQQYEEIRDRVFAEANGSSAGIGRATALLFAKEGASVTIHGRSSESLQKTLDLLKSAGVPENRVLVVQGHIEEDKTCQNLINKTVEKFGKLDILVNNAGIAQKAGAGTLSMENFQYIFDVNLKSVVLLTNLAIPHLEKTKGNIVNVSSGTAIKAFAQRPFYAMTKAALDHFGRCYSLILAEKGIRINTINPGLIATEFRYKTGMNEEQEQKLQKSLSENGIPMHRVGTSEEMASSILFLATDATYMTGANLVADGGVVNFSPTPKLN